MADSEITVDALTATPAIGQITIDLEVTDPHAQGLPYLSLDYVSIVSSLTNDRATASEVGRTLKNFAHSGIAEEVTRYYWARGKNKAGNYFGDWFPADANAGVSAKARGMAGIAFGLANGKITSSVAANALTISVKTTAGNDPSPGDPVYYAFRDPTASDGSYTILAITSALSITVPNGATLGTVNSTPFRVWLVLINDGGTLRLGVIVCTTATRVYPLEESALITSTTIGTGSDSAGVIYSGTGATSKPFRIVGYLTWESGLATAGAWSADPTVRQMFSPGTKKPGEIIQRVPSILTAVDFVDMGSETRIPHDDTIPQNTEGVEITNLTMTPQSAANYVDHRISMNIAGDSGRQFTIAAFQGAAANAVFANTVLTATASTEGGGADETTVELNGFFRTQTGTTSAITFAVRGSVGAGDFTVNGNENGDRLFGGVLASSYVVEEIMA